MEKDVYEKRSGVATYINYGAMQLALCFFVFLGAAAMASATPVVDGLIGDTPGVLDSSEYGLGYLHYFTQDSTGKTLFVGTLYKQYVASENAYYLVFVYNPDIVNDNTYAPKGTKLPTWQWKAGVFNAEGQEHKFTDLLGSDHLKVRINDSTGKPVLDFRIDLIAKNALIKPVYGSCGHYKPYSVYQDKCEAAMVLGNPAMVLKSATSTQWNLWNSGYPIASVEDQIKSPNINNTLYLEKGEYGIMEINPATNKTYQWEFMIIYEWKINASVLNGNGLGNIDIYDVHNSPCKIYSGTSYPIIKPAIDIVKTADKIMIASGDSVTYTYVITNAGNVPLTNISLGDNPLGPVSCPSDVLDIGASMECTLTTQLYDCTAVHLNTGTVTGVAPNGVTVSDQDTELVFVYCPCPNPCINITKSGPEEPVLFGSEITYLFNVSNCGDVNLSGAFMIDPMLGINEAGGGEYYIGDLAVGASVELVAGYEITECDANPLVNTAVAFGQYGAITVADLDSHTVDIIMSYCGDENIDEGEQCDDGNNINGDGCSFDCKTELIPE